MCNNKLGAWCKPQKGSHDLHLNNTFAVEQCYKQQGTVGKVEEFLLKFDINIDDYSFIPNYRRHYHLFSKDAVYDQK